ncbi:uncharacterized protein LOC132927126 [Rhopalosiphum padi]|uniref:uncharacterized protein LOC132927126 n=1 Tax=Rhopalosiphum padi TaxID=40932 RepID=UPI00298DBB1D|nr:uncharacterized protein LOC132927126 [Rhopalosiphum padi]
MHLRSKTFCRICLVEPKSNKHLMLLNIFKSAIRDIPLTQHLKDLLGMEISSKDIKPKTICGKCFIKVADLYEKKQNAADSKKTINYIVSKESKTANKKSFNNTKLKSTPIIDETKLLPVKNNTLNNLFYIYFVFLLFFFFLILYILTFLI